MFSDMRYFAYNNYDSSPIVLNFGYKEQFVVVRSIKRFGETNYVKLSGAFISLENAKKKLKQIRARHSAQPESASDGTGRLIQANTEPRLEEFTILKISFSEVQSNIEQN